MRNDEYYESLISYNNYLAHHGVKGQKWGVRRYQNADGSLTKAGKKHVAMAAGYESLAAGNRKAKEESKGLSRAIYAKNEKTYAKKAAKEQAKIDARIDKDKQAKFQKMAEEGDAKEQALRDTFEKDARAADDLADATIADIKREPGFHGKSMNEAYELCKSRPDLDIENSWDDVLEAMSIGEANALMRVMETKSDLLAAYRKEADSYEAFINNPTSSRVKSYTRPDGTKVSRKNSKSERYENKIDRAEWIDNSIVEKAWDAGSEVMWNSNARDVEIFRAYYRNRRANNPY